MHGDDHGAYDTDVLITGAGRQGWSWHCSAARDYRVAGRARRFSSVDRAPTEGGKVSIRHRERVLTIDGDHLPTSTVATI